MRHVTPAQCVDAVRGTLGREARLELDRHVEECLACAEMLGFWRRFADRVEQDREYEPPAASLDVVKRSVADRPKQPGLVSWAADRVRALTATLTFDTLQQALPAGVRSSTSGTRQLLYDVSPFSLDLLLESGGRSQRILLAGQIANAHDPGNSGQDARVALIGANEEVTAVRANQFGEFHCEFGRREDLVLSIALKDGRNIVVPLDRLPISGYQDEPDSDSGSTPT